MEKLIIYRAEVEDYLFDLVFALYEKDYFLFYENAEIYKDNIVDFIEDNITAFPSKKTPTKLNWLGSFYIFYKSNHRTTWYIFFGQQNTNYLITNILNNHCKEAKWLQTE